MNTSSLRTAIFGKRKRDRTFVHQPFPSVGAITSEDTPNGRFYTTPDGDKFPSVTTVLSKLSKDGIDGWRASIGEEAADEILEQSRTRGTSVHGICERYLLNQEDYVAGEMPFNVATFERIRRVVDTSVGVVYGIEIPLFSRTLKTGGRCDVACEWNGVGSVLDFKSARRKKKPEDILGYFIQATVYSIMIEEMFGVVLPQIVVLIAPDGEMTADAFVRNRRDYFDDVKSVFIDGRN